MHFLSIYDDDVESTRNNSMNTPVLYKQQYNNTYEYIFICLLCMRMPLEFEMTLEFVPVFM
jgi:hypothetical protein